VSGALKRLIHLAGVDDGEQRRLYLDGKLARKANRAGETNPKGAAGKIRIGGGVTGFTIYTVRVSGVARYHKDLTPSRRFEADKDTIALYQFDEGKGDVSKDSSGNANHGRILGPRWVSGRKEPFAP
jgi:hypothetical protein